MFPRVGLAVNSNNKEKMLLLRLVCPHLKASRTSASTVGATVLKEAAICWVWKALRRSAFRCTEGSALRLESADGGLSALETDALQVGLAAWSPAGASSQTAAVDGDAVPLILP